ncbi:MAG: molybdopterin molybdotransferase MoeA [Brevibacterium sp.]|uniref:molybdopterin molybdotransferase MoeA n=1 Tax=Brevibacterium sp. TaxID=1701 RepID=UPI002649D754|nr:molybdopterin molybdotransferase MoeA [Brevibacterium sp.]MDN5806133.1 molybdopterin molybdotransferase MoeA [Brevibacterium sp.]MDN5832641.1 molybdopterin molybdotransferase MoeA [Brevibacterium sp.]MDN5875497.1 molybdopterin molybdotransferase MoeA [Brevibacterium sp.]MDN5908465.1 molybdopterin molybdotransferase MoeA [Brevibacterium sp.]MDN6156842.1 molybdopterin molybdotransferase MoeA [Brevibacterium sp.]
MDPEDYCELIISAALSRTVETIPTVSAIGRIASNDVIAGVPIPAFVTSAMDGFALDEMALRRARAGAEVAMSGDVPAGALPVEITPGTAVRVMTGAQVPTTAEVVVPVEFTDAGRTGPAPERIRVSSLPDGLRAGWNIRSVGEDTLIGDTVMRAGETISAAGVGTLAMMGHETISVQRPLRIGLIVTGDELRADLADSGQPFIHNSNLPMLSSAVTKVGASPVERSCGDDPAAFRRILDELADSVDLIITTGGISAGAFEVVRQALGGDHSTFLRLALRPGGPQGYGRCADTPLLHFPGTPTGAFLSFHLFARSLIDARALGSRWKKAVYAGPEIIGHTKAVSLAPGRFNPAGDVEPTDRSRLRDFADADVIIRVPRAPGTMRTGDIIAVLDC